jgi:tRNA-dihydrouridine synthase A
MIGRAACKTPWILANADSEIFGTELEVKNCSGILEKYLPYAESEIKKGTPLNFLTKPLMGLFHGVPGARKYRTILSSFTRG